MFMKNQDDFRFAGIKVFVAGTAYLFRGSIRGCLSQTGVCTLYAWLRNFLCATWCRWRWLEGFEKWSMSARIPL